MNWQHYKFNQLDINTLYDILKLRTDVFVVEQACHYPELDDLDRHPDSLHIFSYDDDNQLAAYLRCLPPGLVYPDKPAIGRVLTAEHARGKGLGHELIEQGIQACEQHWPQCDIKMSAQTHLQSYYNRHNFVSQGESYVEDGIPHIDMVRVKR